jgi:hypothetical protein
VVVLVHDGRRNLACDDAAEEAAHSWCGVRGARCGVRVRRSGCGQRNARDLATPGDRNPLDPLQVVFDTDHFQSVAC